MASSICSLPDDCISKILSLSSPADACRMLAVSKDLKIPAESNFVWNNFLPSDYSHHIISCVSPLKFSSKKELFLLLSSSVLIDDGNKRSTGRKSYILSARALTIANNDLDWTWKSIQESRFGEVAELKGGERLEIEGKIKSEMLSPNTKYGAYLVFKISEGAYGLDSIPCETFIASGDRVMATNTATLRDPGSKKGGLQGMFYGNRVQKMKERVNDGDDVVARKREDGWLEIEVGEFFVGCHHEIFTMGVMEIKGFQLKGGLILEGIHVRPSL